MLNDFVFDLLRICVEMINAQGDDAHPKTIRPEDHLDSTHLSLTHYQQRLNLWLQNATTPSTMVDFIRKVNLSSTQISNLQKSIAQKISRALEQTSAASTFIEEVQNIKKELTRLETCCFNQDDKSPGLYAMTRKYLQTSPNTLHHAQLSALLETHTEEQTRDEIKKKIALVEKLQETQVAAENQNRALETSITSASIALEALSRANTAHTNAQLDFQATLAATFTDTAGVQRREIEALTQLTVSLRTALAAEKHKNMTLSGALATSQEEHDALKKQFATLQAAKSAVDTKLSASAQDNEKLKAEKLALEEKAKALNTALIEVKAEKASAHDAFTAEISVLKAEIEKQKALIAAHATTIADKTKQIEALTTSLDQMTRQHGELKASTDQTLANQSSEIATLKTTIITLKEQIQSIEQEKEALQTEIAHMLRRLFCYDFEQNPDGFAKMKKACMTRFQHEEGTGLKSKGGVVPPTPQVKDSHAEATAKLPEAAQPFKQIMKFAETQEKDNNGIEALKLYLNAYKNAKDEEKTKRRITLLPSSDASEKERACKKFKEAFNRFFEIESGLPTADVRILDWLDIIVNLPSSIDPTFELKLTPRVIFALYEALLAKFESLKQAKEADNIEFAMNTAQKFYYWVVDALSPLYVDDLNQYYTFDEVRDHFKESGIFSDLLHQQELYFLHFDNKPTPNSIWQRFDAASQTTSSTDPTTRQTHKPLATVPQLSEAPTLFQPRKNGGLPAVASLPANQASIADVGDRCSVPSVTSDTHDAGSSTVTAGKAEPKKSKRKAKGKKKLSTTIDPATAMPTPDSPTASSAAPSRFPSAPSTPSAKASYADSAVLHETPKTPVTTQTLAPPPPPPPPPPASQTTSVKVKKKKSTTKQPALPVAETSSSLLRTTAVASPSARPVDTTAISLEELMNRRLGTLPPQMLEHMQARRLAVEPTSPSAKNDVDDWDDHEKTPAASSGYVILSPQR